MSNSLSTELYLKQRLQELDINELSSDLRKNIDTLNQTIDDLLLVKEDIKEEDKDMFLLCSMSPLLTEFMSIKETRSLDENMTKSISRKSFGNNERWLEVISCEPKAYVCHNFLTDEECEHLISLAKPKLVRSKVRDSTGRGFESSARTSMGAFLRRGQDEMVKEIERKISEFTFIPIKNGEELQVIRYEVGQKFEPHFDGHKRIATVLMYLSDVEEGGETVFPQAKGKNISVSPKKRDALLFWNMKPDGSRDPSSMHGGSPVIKGCKWAATKWFHDHELVKQVSFSRGFHEQPLTKLHLGLCFILTLIFFSKTMC